MKSDLQALERLLPATKHSTESARALVDLGYPAVAPVLPAMFEWMQDFNWPVAKVFAPFLASLGMRCREEIEFVLHSNDSMWKYWVLEEVVAKMSPESIAGLTPLLIDAKGRLSPADVEDEVGIAIDEILRSAAG